MTGYSHVRCNETTYDNTDDPGFDLGDNLHLRYLAMLPYSLN